MARIGLRYRRDTLAGNLTYRAVAEAHGLPYTPLEDVERAMV